MSIHGIQGAQAVPAPEDGPALVARVDLGRLARNFAGLRRASRSLGMLAVVKADAYGHGAVGVARELASLGIEGFCVATLAEALELRRGGIENQILVLEGLPARCLPLASAHHLDLAVVSQDHLRDWGPLVPQHPVGLHLKVDTGMGRSGLLLDELGECLDLIRPLAPWIRGAMGQFADSDEPGGRFLRIQRGRFLGALAQLRDAGVEPAQIHHANTGACLRGFVEGDTHVRCGIGLYGLSGTPGGEDLLPILELEAEVLRSVVVPEGTTVGYGSTFTAPGPLRLATLNCGYADGYPRALANRARAGFRGATYPVVGRISMDMTTVALPADVPLRPGDHMTLLSADPAAPHSVAATARLLSTIPYEVTCALNRRVQRAFS